MTEEKKTKQLILDMVKKIKERYKPDRIILFGSYAYGRPNEDSDVDLLIVKDTPLRPLDRRIEIRKLNYEENKLLPVSPLVFTEDELQSRIKLGDEFIREILQKGTILYEKRK